MKSAFIISAKSLENTMKELNRLKIPNQPVLPILENLLFEKTENGPVTVRKTDLYIDFKIEPSFYEANRGDSFAFLVPEKPLLKLLAKTDDMPLVFRYNPETFQTEISGDDFSTKLTAENPDDFPAESGEYKTVARVEYEKLFETCSKLIPYVMSDKQDRELRPAMTGVFFELNEGTATMTATDAFRVRSITEKMDVKKQERIIVPDTMLKILRKEKGNNTVTISLNARDKRVKFSWEKTELSCRIIDENFPNYRNVIPEDKTLTTRVKFPDKTKLMKTIDKAMIFANQTTHQVKISLNGEAQISAEDIDLSTEFNAKMPCEKTGDDIVIGFNGELLNECLKDTEGIILMSAPNRPVLLTDSRDDIVLLMPLMLKD